MQPSPTTPPPSPRDQASIPAVTQQTPPPVAAVSNVGVDVITSFAAMIGAQRPHESGITHEEWDKLPEKIKNTPMMQMMAKASGLIDKMSCSEQQVLDTYNGISITVKQLVENAQRELESFLSLIKSLAGQYSQSPKQIVQACPASHRREFLLSLITYPHVIGRFNEPLCEAMKINPQAIKQLFNIVINSSGFAFDYTPDIPTLKSAIEAKTLSVIQLCYIFCGLRNPTDQSQYNPPEKELIDKLMHFIAIEKPEYFQYFTRESVAMAGSVKLSKSADRLREAGGSPYSSVYAHLILRDTTVSMQSETVAWLIVPFYKTEPALGIKACYEAYLGEPTALLIPKVIQYLNLQQLFDLLTNDFISKNAKQHSAKRIFELRPAALRVEILSYMMDYLNTLDEDLIDEQVEILFNWVKGLPQEQLKILLKDLVNLRLFPRFWSLFTPAPQVLLPSSNVMKLYREFVYDWPQLLLPANITAPEPDVVQSSSLRCQFLYALQFPDQFSKPTVNPARLVNALHYDSTDNFGEGDDLGSWERYSFSLPILLDKLNEPATITYLRRKLTLFLENAQDFYDDGEFSVTGQLDLLTQALQIVAKVVEPKKVYTDVQAEQVRSLISSAQRNLDGASSRYKNIIPLLIALAEIAQKAPQLIGSEVKLEFFELRLPFMNLTGEEHNQVNKALNIIFALKKWE